MVRFSKYEGSVWIQLNLLKTERWKQCSKMIFECVNSTVAPVFNILFSEQSGYTCYELCTLPPAQWIHVHELWSYCSYTLKTKKKKKKKKKGNVKFKTQTHNKPNPYGNVVMLIFFKCVNSAVAPIFNILFSEYSG